MLCFTLTKVTQVELVRQFGHPSFQLVGSCPTRPNYQCGLLVKFSYKNPMLFILFPTSSQHNTTLQLWSITWRYYAAAVRMGDH